MPAKIRLTGDRGTARTVHLVGHYPSARAVLFQPNERIEGDSTFWPVGPAALRTGTLVVTAMARQGPAASRVLEGSRWFRWPTPRLERSEMLERGRRWTRPQAVQNRVRTIVRGSYRRVDLQVVNPVGMYFLLPADDR
jgi:hypothetical protein